MFTRCPAALELRRPARPAWPLIACLLVATPLQATEIGSERSGGAGPARDAVGVVVGLPQLIGAQWDHPVSRSFDLSLHAGSLIWLVSVGGRLRWRSAAEGLHPYAFAGAALVGIIFVIDDDDAALGTLWGGGGLELIRPGWKMALEAGVMDDANGHPMPSGALSVSWRLGDRASGTPRATGERAGVSGARSAP